MKQKSHLITYIPQIIQSIKKIIEDTKISLENIVTISDYGGLNFYRDYFYHPPFSCIFVNETFCILINISLKFVLKGPFDNVPALV